MTSSEQIVRLQNRPRDVTVALDRVEEFCRIHGFATATVLDVRLIAEEVLTNIVKYAYDGGEDHELELRLSASAQSVRMEFRDEGAPFNPLGTTVPDPTNGPGEGGLGIHLARSLVDDATYVREGSVNVLVLVKHVGSTE
jgi:anti-sigma regulatory factor (Ser/Thr protein kinase)